MGHVKNKFSYSFFVVFILSIVLSGCGGVFHISPKPQNVNSTRIGELNFTKTVNIINNQPSKDKFTIGTSIGRNYISELNDFTKAAVELLSAELSQRGMTISKEASKEIKLAVTGVELTERGFRWNCKVYLNVIAGKNYETALNAHNLSPAHQDRVCGGAITLVITELMNDKEFLDYLNE